MRLIFPALAIFISACSSGGGGGGSLSPLEGDAEGTYDYQGCKDLAPDKGGTADMTLAPAVQVAEGPLGKKYDLTDLQAIHQASSRQSYEFVKNVGVNVMRMEAHPGFECMHFRYVPKATKEHAGVWEKAGGPGKISPAEIAGKSLIFGLYFELCGEEGMARCENRKLVNPSILLYEIGDRRVLVHEMMHHNFNKTRKALPTELTLLETQRLATSAKFAMEDALKEYRRLPDANDLEKMAGEFDKVVTAFIAYINSSPFEEIAIESLLVADYHAKRLSFVSKRSVLGSIDYMASSFKSGEQVLGQFDAIELNGEKFPSISSFIETEAQKKSWFDIVQKVRQSRARIQDHLSQARNAINDSASLIAEMERSTAWGLTATGMNLVPLINEPVSLEYHHENIGAHIDSRTPDWVRDWMYQAGEIQNISN